MRDTGWGMQTGRRVSSPGVDRCVALSLKNRISRVLQAPRVLQAWKTPVHPSTPRRCTAAHAIIYDYYTTWSLRLQCCERIPLRTINPRPRGGPRRGDLGRGTRAARQPASSSLWLMAPHSPNCDSSAGRSHLRPARGYGARGRSDGLSARGGCTPAGIHRAREPGNLGRGAGAHRTHSSTYRMDGRHTCGRRNPCAPG
jgi:hypothetical protein